MGKQRETPVWRPSPKKPYRERDPIVTSRMMSAVRRSGNRAEVLLRKELWAMGLRYRLYRADLIGRPDIVISSRQSVVFVDGDFWHGRGIIDNGVKAFRATLRTPNREWWIEKISRTIQRDREVTTVLENSGWRVIRVWESSVLADPPTVARQVLGQINKSRRGRA
jgi:DNA mismatch endonuclease (patch repair protein)